MEFTPIMVGDSVSYAIKDYDLEVAAAKRFCEEKKQMLPKEIITTEDRKLVKGVRADVNKQLETFKRIRLGLEEQVLGTFNSQMKTIETELKGLEKYLKAIVDEDKVKQEKAKKPVEETAQPYFLIVASLDEATIEKVKAYAEKLGCKAERK